MKARSPRDPNEELIIKKSAHATQTASSHYSSTSSNRFEEWRDLIERSLHLLLPAETEYPASLHQAMRYSIFAGGKRWRPLLLLLAGEAIDSSLFEKASQSLETLDALKTIEKKTSIETGKTVETTATQKLGFSDTQSPSPPTLSAPLIAAVAIECLHTYSLIHDDLPAMDDDDWRRGKPTLHKVAGEAMAILAGDALLTKSFELLATIPPPSNYSLRELFQEMSYAAGSQQLIAGQVEDLESEGKQTDLATVTRIHQGKTCAMIRLATRLGGICSNASQKELETLTQFGEALGLAYQIIDDILDITQSREELGKTARKDLASGKATFPSVIGLEASRAKAHSLTKKAEENLQSLGEKGEVLLATTQELLHRAY